ncbi:class I SAM-dependent methyltransferase [Falsirhodobacter deserti]|uniref:class I SAM-dependent methyltransferase n=1 Tax=Falsirhodobacter deserti TaxID=1365611 RepID=UPI000FE33979|nr:methyltransferase domain-containing protein [Falsirhodobacter deserti]
MKQLILRPHEVVALAPSSDDLARAMVAHLSPLSGRVVEFGAGTGKLTRAILDRGIRPQDLTVFETNPDFCDLLRRRFPGITVHCASAATASGTVEAGIGAVISGLPLLSMTETVQMNIIGSAFRMLAPGASFTQFTYSSRAPIAEGVAAELLLRCERGPKIWANLPPARIWQYRRMQRHAD